MRVVILLGTYNGEKYIRCQIESFFKQTILPDELVISDDASTDDTLKIIREMVVNSPFKITLLENKKNMGYTKNFEKLLRIAEGDVFFLSDQDDNWLPNKIEIVCNTFIEKPNVMLIINDMVLTDENLNVTPYTQLKNIRKLGFSDETYVAGCAVAVKNEYRKLFLPFPENYNKGHDNWIGRISTACNLKYLIEEPLQLYRRHNMNTSKAYASNPENVNRAKAIINYGFVSAIPGWEKELQRNELTLERIKERKDFFVKNHILENYTIAIDTIGRRIEIYKQRIESCKKSRVQRILPLTKMYLTGGYDFFAGYKSLIKDILWK